MKKIILVLLILSSSLLASACYQKLGLSTQENLDKWRIIQDDICFNSSSYERKVKYLINLNITPEIIKEWCEIAGYTTERRFLSNYYKWHVIGVKNPKAVKPWNMYPIEDSDDADRLKFVINSKKTPNQVKEWCKTAGFNTTLGFNSLDIGKGNLINYYKWNAVAGITNPKTVKEWKVMRSPKYDNSIIFPSDVKKLLALGIDTPKKFLKYKGFKLKTIKVMKELKIKPSPLALSAHVTIGYSTPTKKQFLSRYKALKNNGCKKLEKTLFHQSDPYENTGKCYIFSGNLFQRLDRNNGLANKNNNLFYVNFKKSWRENTSKYGYIKGNGKFTYDTTNGRKQTVPKGKVILFMN